MCSSPQGVAKVAEIFPDAGVIAFAEAVLAEVEVDAETAPKVGVVVGTETTYGETACVEVCGTEFSRASVRGASFANAPIATASSPKEMPVKARKRVTKTYSANVRGTIVSF